MINLDQLIEEWKEDSKVNEVELDVSSLESPILHSKYVDYLYDLKKQQRKLARSKRSFPATERRNNSDYMELEECLAQTEDAIEACEKNIQGIRDRGYSRKMEETISS